MNVALAPEGTTLSKQRLFSHPLQSGRNGWKRNWALQAACEPERKPQISPLRFAPVEMTNLLSDGPACIHWIIGNFRATNCHLDRSVPRFPARGIHNFHVCGFLSK